MRNQEQIKELVEFAGQSLKSYGLPDWGIRVSKRMVRSLGICDYRKQEITLSFKMLAQYSESTVYQVLFHEIAHALAGYEAGHGYAFKALACKLGGNTGTKLHVKLL